MKNGKTYKEAKQKITKKVGDVLEKVGRNIQTNATKIGKKVSRVGNKLEHSQDSKK